jgi:predicted transcriptional regulator
MVKEVHLGLDEPRMMFTITHALASEVRIDILNLLDTASLNVNEIAEKLSIPPSTVATKIRLFLRNSRLRALDVTPV